MGKNEAISNDVKIIVDTENMDVPVGQLKWDI